MYRLFKKTGDLAARTAAARARRARRARLGLEALEGRQLLSLIGTESKVNSDPNPPVAQFESDVAASSNGMSVVVWTETFKDTDPRRIDHDIFAQVYDSSGQKLNGQISVDRDSLDERHPSVSMDANGNFVVAYEKAVSSDTLLSHAYSIVAQRYQFNPATRTVSHVGGLDGITVLQGDNGIGDFVTTSGRDPDVAMDAVGDFVVSYTKVHTGLSTSNSDILARRYDSSGTFRQELPISTEGASDETHSTVAMSPDGRFDIAYEVLSSSGGFTNQNIRVDRLSANGGLFEVQEVAGGNTRVFAPSISMDKFGNAVIAYQKLVGGDFDIYAQRLTNAGFLNTDFVVSQAPNVQETNPSVALRADGGPFVVVYETGLLVGATHSNTNRSVEVNEVTGSNVSQGFVNYGANPNNAEPAVAIDGFGFYQLTFTAGVGGATDNTSEDIHTQLGTLNTAPKVQNLTLPKSVKVGEAASLTGTLVDADGDTNLTLRVVWGDGSKEEVFAAGTDPFDVQHVYAEAGTYTVHVTWTDSTGLSNSRDLTIKVKKSK
jgi:hypothetical protein